jgi:hypothetical protein
MSWLILFILIGLTGFFLLVGNLRHKFFIIILLVLILFVYVSGSLVLDDENIDWKSVKGLYKGVRTYLAWLGSFFSNIQELTGKAADMNWQLDNENNSNDSLINIE